MNKRLVFRIVGALLLALAATMAVPVVLAVLFREETLRAWLLTVVITAAAGLLLSRFKSGQQELGHRDAYLVVTLTWLSFSLFGGLPFLLAGMVSGPIDAMFEAMSGFTTTGATVLSGLDRMDKSILFWRAFTQWLGGMGIIVLSVAILPLLGVGGMQLYRAEASGDRLTPRIAETAKLLWGIYALFTFLEALLLRWAGMGMFDAVCHAFTTMATGGFSNYDTGIAAFGNPRIEWIIILFMILAGTSFSLHYRAVRGKIGSYWESGEFKFYLFTILTATVIISLNTWALDLGRVISRLRTVLFTVTSIVTTTGYATKDFDLWPSLARFILLTLMFLGGCAGSTSGGMKNIRVLLLFKQSFVEIKKFIFPKAVLPVKVGSSVIAPDVMSNVQGFFLLYMVWFFFASACMSLAGLDLVTASSSVVTVMSNIGPGLGQVGPALTYAGIPDLGKVILILSMLVGRLELYTVLVLFSPDAWRK